MAEPDHSLTSWLEESRLWIEGHLGVALQGAAESPKSHAEALAYPLLGGGKRLRPALVRLVCSSLGGADSSAVAPAVAVEMVHTYSLVHDDLPCMDDDDLRRGRPTCHVAYGEAQAVLVGDGLQALAFETLGASGHPRAAEMVRVLARGAGPAGMVGGQALDLAGGSGDSVEAVREIHLRKTAALLAASTELGALAASASEGACQAMGRYGLSLGLCFQAVDDVLDVVGDEASLGKTPGKDAQAQKATLVDALGLDGARSEARIRAEQARGHALAAGAAEGGLLTQVVDYFLARTG